MIPAEKWYKHQESYRKYGPDMKPHKERKTKQNKKNVEISRRDKFRIAMLVICTGILCIGLIVSTAYAASLKFEINRLIMANNDIEGEIENLHMNLKKNTNISMIEEKAIKELGMTYALPEQIQYLEEREDVNSDFASILKEEAYN